MEASLHEVEALKFQLERVAEEVSDRSPLKSTYILILHYIF